MRSASCVGPARAVAMWSGALLLSSLGATAAHAHKPSDSYLRVAVADQDLAVRWDVSLRDLDFDLALDVDGDGQLTWGEVRHAGARIAAYALPQLTVRGDGASCPLSAAAGAPRIVEHSDGAYLVLALRGRCPQPPRVLELEYQLLFARDPQHRGLLTVRAGGPPSTHIFRPDARHVTVSLVHRSAWAELLSFVREGVWHVWIGLDHVLFLLALLLPAVLLRQGRQWSAAPALRPALLDVLKVVTAFTAAHSITLTLASLSVVSLPSRLIESGIALSVVVAALNNLWPVVPVHRWVVAFLLGLLHGFGFSSVLVDLGMPESHLWAALLGFNGGVELGQLAIVAVFVPLAFALRASWFYRRVVVLGGSAAIALLALVWSVERVFVVSIL